MTRTTPSGPSRATRRSLKLPPSSPRVWASSSKPWSGRSLGRGWEAVKRKALRLRDMALIFGLASLATLGIAAVFITVGAPDPITQASAVIGTALSLGWAIKIAWK